VQTVAVAAGTKILNDPHIEVAPVETEIGILRLDVEAEARTVDASQTIGNLSQQMGSGATTVRLSAAASTAVAVGDILRVGAVELVRVTAITSQSHFTVTRGVLGTSTRTHAANTAVKLVTLLISGIELNANAAHTISANDVLTIGNEIMIVRHVVSQKSFSVSRGDHGTEATAHRLGAVVETVGAFVDLTAWTKKLMWRITNQSGNATGSGADYQQTVPVGRPKEGPATLEIMKSFTAGKVDKTLAPLARNGKYFFAKARNETDQNVSATNPHYAGRGHSLADYEPVTTDVDSTDVATLAITFEIADTLHETLE